MKINLVVTHGAHQGKTISVNKPEFFIGRDPQCNLRPAAVSVSKKHCSLSVREDKAFLKDLNSTNGTFVNDQPVKGEVELKNDDRLKIGPLTFVVQLMEDDTAETTAVDKGTAVDRPKPGAVPVKAKAKHKAKAPDEDAIADMLLQLDEEEEASSGDGGLVEDEIPGGSTIMDMLAAQVPEANKEPMKPKPAEKPEGNTQNAAKQILDKYSRRR